MGKMLTPEPVLSRILPEGALSSQIIHAKSPMFLGIVVEGVVCPRVL